MHATIHVRSQDFCGLTIHSLGISGFETTSSDNDRFCSEWLQDNLLLSSPTGIKFASTLTYWVFKLVLWATAWWQPRHWVRPSERFRVEELELQSCIVVLARELSQPMLQQSCKWVALETYSEHAFENACFMQVPAVASKRLQAKLAQNMLITQLEAS